MYNMQRQRLETNLALGGELGLLERGLRALGELALVRDNVDVLLGQVLDLAILDLPELFGDL